jgi:aldehyde dehydrogenase (NAD+)
MMVAATETSLPFTRSRFSVSLNQLYINEEWRNASNGKTFPVIDPSTEAEVAQIAEGTAEDAEAAIASAHQAFETGPWVQMSWNWVENQPILFLLMPI